MNVRPSPLVSVVLGIIIIIIIDLTDPEPHILQQATANTIRYCVLATNG